ncbi:hypothetical protein [Mycobacterium sp. 852014-50255_SCH5639931]|uniref:hypothetical protein n=1 Tax=Mycobacterium sp. 852014-50255_SCH5639931 TaxID=1834112 RepID=UPI0018D3ABD1|nr:hypothetical protein [Mycobacterium sp. 852014-50255_SCH5639931]
MATADREAIISVKGIAVIAAIATLWPVDGEETMGVTPTRNFGITGLAATLVMPGGALSGIAHADPPGDLTVPRER